MLVAGVADGFARATLDTLAAKSQLLRRRWLAKDICNTACVVATEVVRGGLAAEVAIKALVVHEEFAGHAKRNSIANLGVSSWRLVGHRLVLLSFTRDARKRLTSKRWHRWGGTERREQG